MKNTNLSTCCECTPVGETWFGEERGRPPSLAVVEAVAAAEGVTPEELDPLFGTIDPDMLDQLFADPGDTSVSSILLRFSFAGWNVFVRGDGAIRVCDPDRSTEPEPVFQKAIGD